MRLRPLLIGQAPGPRTDPEMPLFPVPSTSAGGRLQDLMGLRRGQYLEMFERVNLLPYFPGSNSQGDKFPMRPAKLAASVMKPLLVDRTVIMVGRQVAQAFGHEAEFLEWTELRCRRPSHHPRCPGLAKVLVIPHPSGRNHWYNNAENKRTAEEVLQKLVVLCTNED